MSGGFVGGLIVPGLPHPLLAADRSPGWMNLRKAFERARQTIAQLDPDLLVLYSTQWISVIGHQIQAHPRPQWSLVDQEWHELGEMRYSFPVDSEFAASWQKAARRRGLHARTVAYDGFPVDTGSVVALTLLDPEQRIPSGIVSCNMYSDRAETVVLGKAARDAVESSGRRALAVAVTGLSCRLFTRQIDPAEDRISSLKDDEWNRKLLEILGRGRLEDVCHLAREFDVQANADQKLKAIWWLAAAVGQHNAYEAKVHEYQPIWGTGAAVVELIPSRDGAADLEFDEDDVEVFGGDRGVLEADEPSVGGFESATPTDEEVVRSELAPKPVGAYPHARRVGDLLFLSGIGPRQVGTDDVPGGPIRDGDGQPQPYDIRAQTRAVIENVRTILGDAGGSLDDVLDVTVFLVDMERDFQGFNEVWSDLMGNTGATRTTVALSALPTPIAVEFKVIARAR